MKADHIHRAFALEPLQWEVNLIKLFQRGKKGGQDNHSHALHMIINVLFLTRNGKKSPCQNGRNRAFGVFFGPLQTMIIGFSS
jgi:hypothetical protein